VLKSPEEEWIHIFVVVHHRTGTSRQDMTLLTKVRGEICHDRDICPRVRLLVAIQLAASIEKITMSFGPMSPHENVLHILRAVVEAILYRDGIAFTLEGPDESLLAFLAISFCGTIWRPPKRLQLCTYWQRINCLESPRR